VDSVTPEIVDVHVLRMYKNVNIVDTKMSHVFLGYLTPNVAMDTHWLVLVGMDAYKMPLDTS
jgi:hypothetical protein